MEPAVDLLGGVLGALDRDLGDAGQVVEGDHVADDEDLGVARQREVGVDGDPAGAVERGAGLVRERPAQRARLHTGRPHLGDGADALLAAVLVLHDQAALVDLRDQRAEHDLDAEALELLLGPGAEPGAERRQHLRCRVDQYDARVVAADRTEVAGQGAVRELGDLAGHLDAGRSGADDDEGQQVVDVLAARGADLGQLERAEDPPAQLEGVVDALHARGELGEVVVAEVGLAGAGGDDQRVVRRRQLAPEDLRGDRPGLEVDVDDLAEQDLGVLLPRQHLAGRRRDLSLGEDAGRDLVEQRLEQVVAGLRAIMVTSTSARLSALVPNRPPKPEPMTTTWCRSERGTSARSPGWVS